MSFHHLYLLHLGRWIPHRAVIVVFRAASQQGCRPHLSASTSTPSHGRHWIGRPKLVSSLTRTTLPTASMSYASGSHSRSSSFCGSAPTLSGPRQSGESSRRRQPSLSTFQSGRLPRAGSDDRSSARWWHIRRRSRRWSFFTVAENNHGPALCSAKGRRSILALALLAQSPQHPGRVVFAEPTEPPFSPEPPNPGLRRWAAIHRNET